MYSELLTTRSPLRVLEKGLHGGLGHGNLGLVVAGPGVGKTAFLVDLALDGLLRGGQVLHVSLDHTVAHVRTYYDTVFEELAASIHLEDAARVHADIDRLRSIRAYSPEDFGPDKLNDALKIESEASTKPDVLILDGYNLRAASRSDIEALRNIASSQGAEFWVSVVRNEGQISDLPDEVEINEELFDVILVLESGPETVSLRCLKEHDNPDPLALHIHLDPTSLLIAQD